jgi:hypothetical protein
MKALLVSRVPREFWSDIVSGQSFHRPFLHLREIVLDDLDLGPDFSFNFFPNLQKVTLI